jgi:hypothetical protein
MTRKPVSSPSWSEAALVALDDDQLVRLYDVLAYPANSIGRRLGKRRRLQLRDRVAELMSGRLLEANAIEARLVAKNSCLTEQVRLAEEAEKDNYQKRSDLASFAQLIITIAAYIGAGAQSKLKYVDFNEEDSAIELIVLGITCQIIKVETDDPLHQDCLELIIRSSNWPDLMHLERGRLTPEQVGAVVGRFRAARKQAQRSRRRTRRAA